MIRMDGDLHWRASRGVARSTCDIAARGASGTPLLEPVADKIREGARLHDIGERRQDVADVTGELIG
jgi:hypothetical protein